MTSREPLPRGLVRHPSSHPPRGRLNQKHLQASIAQARRGPLGPLGPLRSHAPMKGSSLRRPREVTREGMSPRTGDVDSQASVSFVDSSRARASEYIDDDSAGAATATELVDQAFPRRSTEARMSASARDFLQHRSKGRKARIPSAGSSLLEAPRDPNGSVSGQGDDKRSTIAAAAPPVSLDPFTSNLLLSGKLGGGVAPPRRSQMRRGKLGRALISSTIS